MIPSLPATREVTIAILSKTCGYVSVLVLIAFMVVALRQAGMCELRQDGPRTESGSLASMHFITDGSRLSVGYS